MVGPAGLPVFPLLMRQPYHGEARHATLRKRAPSVFKRAPSVFKRAPSVFKRAPAVHPNPSCRHPTCRYPSCRYPSCARAARPARRHPNRPDAQPPRSRPAPWEPVHLPHPPAPAPQGAGEARGGLKTIEQATTQTRSRTPTQRTLRTDEMSLNEERAWEESEASGLPVRDGRPGVMSLLLSPCSSSAYGLVCFVVAVVLRARGGARRDTFGVPPRPWVYPRRENPRSDAL